MDRQEAFKHEGNTSSLPSSSSSSSSWTPIKPSLATASLTTSIFSGFQNITTKDMINKHSFYVDVFVVSYTNLNIFCSPCCHSCWQMKLFLLPQLDSLPNDIADDAHNDRRRRMVIETRVMVIYLESWPTLLSMLEMALQSLLLHRG